jgi:hypothetical protein
MMGNTLEIVGKTPENKIEVAVRSPNERDLHAMIEDPYAHIMAIATQMGYTLTVQDTSTNISSEERKSQAKISEGTGREIAETSPE